MGTEKRRAMHLCFNRGVTDGYWWCAYYAPQNPTHTLTELFLFLLSIKESLSFPLSSLLSPYSLLFLFSSLQSQECFSKLFPPPTPPFFPSVSLSLSHANIHTPNPGQYPGPPSFIPSSASSILESNLLLISTPSYGTCRSWRYYRKVTCRQSQAREASAAFWGRDQAALCCFQGYFPETAQSIGAPSPRQDLRYSFSYLFIFKEWLWLYLYEFHLCLFVYGYCFEAGLLQFLNLPWGNWLCKCIVLKWVFFNSWVWLGKFLFGEV